MNLPVLTEDKSKKRYKLRLSKTLYNETLLSKVLKENPSFAKRFDSDRNHIYIAISTSNTKNVLEWVNYLFYRNKINK